MNQLKKYFCLMVCVLLVGSGVCHSVSAQTKKEAVSVQGVALGGQPVTVNNWEDNQKAVINRQMTVNGEENYVDIRLQVHITENAPIATPDSTATTATTPATGDASGGAAFWLLFAVGGVLLVIVGKKRAKKQLPLLIVALLIPALLFLPQNASAQVKEDIAVETLSDAFLRGFSFERVLSGDNEKSVELIKNGDKEVTGFRWAVKRGEKYELVYRCKLRDDLGEKIFDKEIPVTTSTQLVGYFADGKQQTADFPYLSLQLKEQPVVPDYQLKVEHYTWDGEEEALFQETTVGVNEGQTCRAGDYAITDNPDVAYLDHSIDGWFTYPGEDSVTVKEGQEHYTLKLYYGKKATATVYKKETLKFGGFRNYDELGNLTNTEYYLGTQELNQLTDIAILASYRANPQYESISCKGIYSKTVKATITDCYEGQTIDLTQYIELIKKGPGPLSYSVGTPIIATRTPKLVAGANEFEIEYMAEIRY